MEECLEIDEICSYTNQKCKTCKLDECKNTIRMCDMKIKKDEAKKMNQLKKELPEQCKNCSFLQIININEKKVYCPYRLCERCVIENYKKSFEHNS